MRAACVLGCDRHACYFLTALSDQAPSFRLERADTPILAFAVVLAAYHIHLLGRGAFAWPDEHLYFDAWNGVRALQAGDFREFARAITGFGARPLEALMRLAPAWLQLVLEDQHGIPRTMAESMRIPTSWNVIVSFLLTMVFYRLSRWLFASSRGLAVVATIVYSLLVSTNIWIRHVSPYDAGLLLALLAFALVLRIPLEAVTRATWLTCIKTLVPTGILVLAYPIAFLRYRSSAIPLVIAILAALAWSLLSLTRNANSSVNRWASIAGVVAAAATATYPAYYSLPAVFGALVLIGAQPDALIDWKRLQIRSFCVYGVSAALVLFTFELLSRIGGVSYLGSAARLSKTIGLGNFDEGYIFLPRYFLAVESYVGAALLLLAALYVPLRLISRNLRPTELAFVRVEILIGIAYLVYATQSTVLHKMAFTERYIRMYVPFLVWAAIGAIALVRPRAVRATLATGCVVASVASFVVFARDYDRVGYPLDVLRDLRIGYEDVVPENRIDEAEIYPKYNLPVKAMVSAPGWITRPNDRRFVLVNFSFFWATGKGLPRYVPPPGAVALYDAEHYLTFRSAPFEGWMPERRREYRERNYRLTVYRVPDVAR